MSISIQTNVNAMVAQENLRANTDFQSKTIERLTSGYRINSSGDDAAGLAVANKFRSDTAELTQGVRNANDGISQLQIIDGGANNISKILDRMKTLATQSATRTFTGNRATLNTEFSQLATEIDRQAANVGMDTSGAFNKSLRRLYRRRDERLDFEQRESDDRSFRRGNCDRQHGAGPDGHQRRGRCDRLGRCEAGFVTVASSFSVTTLDSTGKSATTAFTAKSGDGGTVADVVADLNKQVSANAATAASGVTFAIGSDGNLKVGGSQAVCAQRDGPGEFAPGGRSLGHPEPGDVQRNVRRRCAIRHCVERRLRSRTQPAIHARSPLPVGMTGAAAGRRDQCADQRHRHHRPVQPGRGQAVVPEQQRVQLYQ